MRGDNQTLSRRQLLRAFGGLGAGGLLAAACGGQSGQTSASAPPVATTSAAAATPAGSGLDLDALVAAAKKEGTLSFYASGAQPAAEALVAAFKSRYGIPVDLFASGDTQIIQRVQTELDAKKLGSDVVSLTDTSMFQLTQRGVLDNWDPPTRAKIPSTFKTPEWTTFRLSVGALAWNTGRVKATDAPKDWQDLADPKWKNRIGMGDPAVNTAALIWAYMAQKLYGDSIFKAIGANRPKLYSSTQLVPPAIISGEIDAGIVVDYSIVQSKAANAPYDGVIPESSFFIGQSIGVPKAPPHPNAARLFYHYTCSAEGDAAYCAAVQSIATNPDSSVPGAFKISDVKRPIAVDAAELSAKQAQIIDTFKKSLQ